jgi:hypothetical protein
MDKVGMSCKWPSKWLRIWPLITFLRRQPFKNNSCHKLWENPSNRSLGDWRMPTWNCFSIVVDVWIGSPRDPKYRPESRPAEPASRSRSGRSLSPKPHCPWRHGRARTLSRAAERWVALLLLGRRETKFLPQLPVGRKFWMNTTSSLIVLKKSTDFNFFLVLAPFAFHSTFLHSHTSLKSCP